MPDDPARQSQIERAIQRAFSESGLSRRAFLGKLGRGSLVAASALSLPAILAACGIKPAASQRSLTSASTAATLAPLPSPAGTLNFANWPAYIDIDDKDGSYPTIKKFEAASKIKVAYTEDINDNEEFFGKIQPDLAAGNPPAYDLIVMTDWMIAKMIRLGYLEELHLDALPNFTANGDDLYKNPWYDPGNQHSLAWQSGITGIGYNPKLTGRPITTFDDLLDPKFKGRVGMFSEMRDTMSMALLSMGVKPENATVADVQKAGDKLQTARSNGQFRNFYGNDYYDQLAGKNLALTIAWSGDVTQMKLYDNPDVEFVVPDSGGMRWVDNMAIPKNADHPADAHAMMNFWYDPANAVPLSEYIGYFSPVKGVPDLVRADATAAAGGGDKETAAQLNTVADTVTPSDATLKNVFTYKLLDDAEEKQWNDIFQKVVSG